MADVAQPKVDMADPTTQPDAMPAFRIASRIPGAGFAYEKAVAWYTFGKDTTSSIPMVNGIVSATERKFNEVATPLLLKHSSTIDYLDNYACDHVDNIESTVAAVTTSVINKSRELVQQKVVSPIDSAVAPAVKIGLNLADSALDLLLPGALETEAEHTKDSTSSAEESTSESMLAQPELTQLPLDAESCHVPMVQLCAPELSDAALRCRGVVFKAKLRAYNASIKHLDHVKARAAEKIESMKPYTVDLISYAKTVIDNPTASVALFPQASEQASQQALEARAKAVAVTKSTATYIRDQRALLRTALGKHANEAFEFARTRGVQPIHEFLKTHLEKSDTWESFSKSLATYRKQAVVIRAQLEENESIGATLDRIAKGYMGFEEIADPYTMQLLSAARKWVILHASRLDAEVFGEADDDDNADADADDFDADDSRDERTEMIDLTHETEGADSPDTVKKDRQATDPSGGASADTGMSLVTDATAGASSDEDEDVDGGGLVFAVRKSPPATTNARRERRRSAVDDLDDAALLLAAPKPTPQKK